MIEFPKYSYLPQVSYTHEQTDNSNQAFRKSFEICCSGRKRDAKKKRKIAESVPTVASWAEWIDYHKAKEAEKEQHRANVEEKKRTCQEISAKKKREREETQSKIATEKAVQGAKQTSRKNNEKQE